MQQAAQDTCFFQGSAIDEWTTLSFGEPWTVTSANTWGDDRVGWYSQWVAYYRAQGRAPCGVTMYQQMAMYCSNDKENPYRNYGPVK